MYTIYIYPCIYIYIFFIHSLSLIFLFNVFHFRANLFKYLKKVIFMRRVDLSGRTKKRLLKSFFHAHRQPNFYVIYILIYAYIEKHILREANKLSVQAKTFLASRWLLLCVYGQHLVHISLIFMRLPFPLSFLCLSLSTFFSVCCQHICHSILFSNSSCVLSSSCEAVISEHFSTFLRIPRRFICFEDCFVAHNWVNNGSCARLCCHPSWPVYVCVCVCV